MKIIHIVSGLGTGGAEKMLYRLISELSSHTHVIVSLTSTGSVGKQLLSEGFDVRVFDLRGWAVIFSLIKLFAFIRKSKPDLIQTWMYHADLVGAIIGRISGVKRIVWNIRNTKIPQGKFSLTATIIFICAKLSYLLPTKIVCCAQSALKHHSDYGYSKKKLVLIPNGYNTQSFSPSQFNRTVSRELLQIPHDKFVVGVIGRFDVLKGYDTFIKAAGFLAQSYSREIIFLAAGPNVDAENCDLVNLIHTYAPNTCFKLLGERDDIPKVIAALDIFCLSSKSEGFPNVVAEAMLMQIPCAVTDVGDAREIVGPTGIVVPADDSLALAHAIKKMMSQGKSARTELGIFARQRICEKYSIEAVALQYELLYQSLER